MPALPGAVAAHGRRDERPAGVCPSRFIRDREAIAYPLGNWAALLRYTVDGELEIDNNAAERSLRGVAVGRKNWLFFRSDTGGRTAAILTSLVTTCKRLHVDPFAYLRDVFDRTSAHPASRLAEFLPDQWKAAQTNPTSC